MLYRKEVFMSSFENNLSEGNVIKQLVKFSLPFLISNIIQSLYSVADLWIVGNVNGSVSISGVNVGSQITFILTNIIAGLCTGGTVLIAQYLGAKDRKSMKDTTATLITMLGISSLIITVLMLVFKNGILRVLKTPAEAFSEASNYLFVTSLGITFIFAYNALSAIMRGMGDSKRPFYFVLIACVTNIVLDIVLVAGFHMGAMGAAIATVLAQALSVVLCIIYMVKHDFIFDFKPKSFRLDAHSTKMILRVGTPTAVQNGITGISFLVITTLANSINYSASAAVGIVGKFNGFAILPAVAMSASISTMAAQNIGAGEWKRAVKTFHAGTIIAFVISGCIFAIAMLFPTQILQLFDKTDPVMIQSGVEYMRTFCWDYLFVPLLFGLNGLFVGAGHTTFSLLNGSMSALLLRIPCSILFGMLFGMGMTGIGLGAPVATLGSLVIAIWFYLSKRWRVSKIVQRREIEE